ncbi:MAG: CPBP family intramembrane metalloprotease [Clostridia bacterium]|nr:CPBP family intramembrane metalloprotease [Clostridia bacterium]
MEQTPVNSDGQRARKPRRDWFLRPACAIEAEQMSRSHPLALEILLFIAVYLCSGMVQGLIIAIPACISLFSSEAFQAAMAGLIETGDSAAYMEAVMESASSLPSWLHILNLFSTVIIIIGVIVYCRYIEKRSLRSMGLVRNGALREYLLGLGIGFALFCAALLLCLVTGTLTIDGIAESFAPLSVLLFFFAYLVQGMNEELLCRGYFMISVARRQSLPVAIFTNAALFAALHLANTGIGVLSLINLFLFGVLMSVYMLKRGSIWGAAAMHSIWNFVQGNLFGISVSGTDAGASVFASTLTARGTLINGGVFGLEGGLAVTLVLVSAILFLTFKLPPKVDFQRLTY